MAYRGRASGEYQVEIGVWRGVTRGIERSPNANLVPPLACQANPHGASLLGPTAQRIFHVVRFLFQLDPPPPPGAKSIHEPVENRLLHFAIAETAGTKAFRPLLLFLRCDEQLENAV